jgi:hypothetical protein
VLEQLKKLFCKTSSFGANHDVGSGETLNCPTSLNYIMAPAPQQSNLLNKFMFSSCSIAQFKSTLLSSSG